MGVTPRLVCSVASLVLLASSAGAAQHAQTREGFWIGLGGGWGDAVLSCSPNCTFTQAAKGGAATAWVKLGGTLRRDVLLGVELNAWVKNVSGSTESVGNASAAVYYYLMPDGGLFLKGGVGYATFRPSSGTTTSGNGFGLIAGAGYDVRIGRNVSLTPVGNFLFGDDGHVTGSGLTVPQSVKHSVIELGLGITFH